MEKVVWHFTGNGNEEVLKDANLPSQESGLWTHHGISFYSKQFASVFLINNEQVEGLELA